MWVPSLGWDDPLEEGTPVFLPGESPWAEEPDGLLSIGLHKVRHNWSNLACSKHKQWPLNTYSLNILFCFQLQQHWAPVFHRQDLWKLLYMSFLLLLIFSFPGDLCQCSVGHDYETTRHSLISLLLTWYSVLGKDTVISRKMVLAPFAVSSIAHEKLKLFWKLTEKSPSYKKGQAWEKGSHLPLCFCPLVMNSTVPLRQ